MNEQQKERIFKLLKEICEVSKEDYPEIISINLTLNENFSKYAKNYEFFGFHKGDEKSTVDAFRFDEKEKDAADQS